MIQLSELASRILAHLEEAHAENVSSTINTVESVRGNIEEISHAQSALLQLTNLDLVRIAYEDAKTGKFIPISKDQSIVDISTINDRLRFSDAERIWRWDQNFPMMEILATPAGLAKSREILAKRGYEWWRHQE
ncbi:hypothetical protein [Hyphomicrobium sp.]|uniref:hypothetical protein n=1 Tax=Hyphomicrobium sp. TaxID=82 RepID=UPI002D77023A|nr:hypothetical protein [Hyphomicrobium sp.]HET6390784.1 hypothetical protein [Hyphomicrobium sp.]